MPRRCSVCPHPDRTALDAALVAGGSIRRIAADHSVSESSLRRHHANCLPYQLMRAAEIEEVTEADDLLGQLNGLKADAKRIGKRAEQSGDLRAALMGIRELVRITELMAKLRGELDERATVNILVAPQWLEVRTALFTALQPYPEARGAVAAQLLSLEAGTETAHGERLEVPTPGTVEPRGRA